MSVRIIKLISQLAWVLGILLLCAVSCKKEPQPGGQPDGGKPRAGSESKPLERSIFAGTSLTEAAPGSIDISRDGQRLFVRTQLPGDYEFSVLCFEFAGGKLGPMIQLAQSLKYNRDFLRAHPSETRCLIIVTVQEEDGRIVDQLWELRDHPVRLKYEAAPELPAGLPADAFTGISPIYSWDAETVIVPLKHRGLCVYDMQKNESHFVAYPELGAEVTGSNFGALPPADDAEYVFASFWSVTGGPEEKCAVQLLNLSTLQWEAKVTPPWVVYAIGADNPVTDLWLASGSRPPEVNTEHARLPRLGRIDPTSGMADLLEFNGEPVWDVLVDPKGQHVVYADSGRQAVVRHNPSSGLLELDKSSYDPKAKLLYCSGTGDVFAWNKTILLKAEFAEQEQFEGFGE